MISRLQRSPNLLAKQVVPFRTLQPKFCSTPAKSWLSRTYISLESDACLKKFNASVPRSSVVSHAANQDYGTRGTGLEKREATGNVISPNSYNGVFLLLLLNVALYAADHLAGLPVRNLYLNHWSPRWYQFLTSAFCHASWQHLSGNAFLLLIFGRNVEEEEGAFGVIASYIFCALGANVASYLMMPRNVQSLGASGAVFGLFVVAVVSKLSWNPRKLLESAILGQFVIQQVINEAKMQFGTQGMTIAGAKVGHLAHLFGALAGVLLVFLLSRIPVPAEPSK